MPDVRRFAVINLLIFFNQMPYEAKLDGLGTTWVSGVDLMDMEITLGVGKNSSSIKITLADKLHKIGKALINHAAKIGGIRSINPPTANSTPDTAGGGSVSVTGNGTVSRGSIWSPSVLAAADAIAHKEVADYLGRKGYYSNNGIGYFTDVDIAAGGGFPASAGTTQNVGRYQFNRGDWEHMKRLDPSITGFTPEDQDKMMYAKMMKFGRGGKELLAGDIEGFMRGAGKEWASIPESTADSRGVGYQVQKGYTKEKFLAFYNQRLNYYKGSTTQAAANTSADSGNKGAVSGTVARGGRFTPEILAILDVAAKKETDNPNELRGYYQHTIRAGMPSHTDDADIAAGGGFPASAGTTRRVGRYQFKRSDWQTAIDRGYITGGFDPATQDKIALSKLDYRKIPAPLMAGDIMQTMRLLGQEWASVPGSPYGQVQAGTNIGEYIDYYNQRLDYYKKGTTQAVPSPK